jgi:hypothetical protein
MRLLSMMQTCHILQPKAKRRMQENNRWVSLENVTTATANIEEFLSTGSAMTQIWIWKLLTIPVSEVLC